MDSTQIVKQRCGESLRPYQEECLASILDNYNNGIKRQLLVLATGLGKTVIAAQLPKLFEGILNGKLVFIAHRDELIKQAVEKIGHWNPRLKIGIEKANQHADLDCDVIVACNASIGRADANRMDKFWDSVSIVVIDETHRVLGDSYLNIIEDAGVLLPNNNKLLIGLTATPKRRNVIKDEDTIISLKNIFEKITFSYPIRKGIKEGYLSPLCGFRITTKTDISDVKTTAGDFQTAQLSNAVNTHERNALVVKNWKEHAQSRPTLCFTVDIQHAKDLADSFLQEGVKAQAIYGDDKDRKEKLTLFERGDIDVLCNCALLTEGFDCPKVSCIALARPTKSGTLYTQMVGRGTRVCDGKSNCVVLDFVDNSRRCSLVTLPSLAGLNPDFDLAGESVTAVAEKLEAIEQKYPGVPLRTLTNLGQIDSYIESFDMLTDPYPEEVKELSDMMWMVGTDGAYVLQIPEKESLRKEKAWSKFLHEQLHITQNELDEYELSISSVSQNRSLGTFNTLKEAFGTADEVIRRCRPDRVKLIQREQAWKNNLASDPAKAYLKKLSKNKPMHFCLCPGIAPAGVKCTICGKLTGITAGQCATAISIFQQRRK